MKILFVILLIAGGIIYAGTQGAFKRHSVEKSFGVEEKNTRPITPQVSSAAGFTMKQDAPKTGDESIKTQKNDAKSKDEVIVGNDESDPYSKHVDEKAIASSADDSSKTLLQKISDASSIGEVLALLKEAATGNTKQEVPKTDQTKDTDYGDILNDEITVSSPSDKDPILVVQEQVKNQQEEKKHTMVVVLPVDEQSSEVDKTTGVVIVKNSSPSSSLLSVCKTKYSTTTDVRIVNQVSSFNINTKKVESMTFEVECL